MLPGLTVPASLAELLGAFRGCFTAPSFATFAAMVVGLVAQPGRRTVCGMLAGAGLVRAWSHHLAHEGRGHGGSWSTCLRSIRNLSVLAVAFAACSSRSVSRSVPSGLSRRSTAVSCGLFWTRIWFRIGRRAISCAVWSGLAGRRILRVPTRGGRRYSLVGARRRGWTGGASPCRSWPGSSIGWRSARRGPDVPGLVLRSTPFSPRSASFCGFAPGPG
jgi:hypothetical protein